MTQRHDRNGLMMKQVKDINHALGMVVHELLDFV
jgi:hypothetical protein